MNSIFDTYEYGEETDTRSIPWFQLGDIGPERKEILDNLPERCTSTCNLEELGDNRLEHDATEDLKQKRVTGVNQIIAGLRTMVASTLVGAWTAIEREKTHPITVFPEAGHVLMENQRVSYPIADFFEPVEYNWSEIDFEVDRALEHFSEQTYADY